MFAEIAITDKKIPFALGTLQYRVPGCFQGLVANGALVRVPLRQGEASGYVVSLSSEPRVHPARDILSVADNGAALRPEKIAIASWLSATYMAPIGECVRLFLPPGRAKNGTVPEPEPQCKGTDVIPFELTPEQASAVAAITKALDGTPEKFLLYGETGSGKTEVYLRAVQESLRLGKAAIVVVPEISLTPQLAGYFSSRLGDIVAVWHSALPPSRRATLWGGIESGKYKVILGARSALFTPVRDLGLIIVDEEHESSLKQNQAPRYHVRETAVAICNILGATFVAGSATPSLEALRLAHEGTFTMLRMKKRVTVHPSPQIKVVDMRKEFRAGNRSIFSAELLAGLDEAVGGGDQAILFVNRRGYSTFWLCRDCGHVPSCRHCQVSLTFHDDGQGKLICHHCGYWESAVPLCGSCGSNAVRPFGTGTQKVVRELAAIRPGLSVIRVDSDSTRPSGAHEKLLSAFLSTPGAVMVGTQIIAKGLDIPAVRFVGIVNADTALNLPDFRAGERTFQLLKQVAGRAGRGRAKGRVVIQTYSPEHYAIQSVAAQDTRVFYKREWDQRLELQFPPFSTIINLIVSSPFEDAAWEYASKIGRSLSEVSGIGELYGPMRAPIARIAGRHRLQLVLKTTARREALTLLRKVMEEHPAGDEVRLTCDVDPQMML